MLVEKDCFRTTEPTLTYTFELQLQMPHITSHRAVIVDLMTADGETRLRECEDASRSHDVERMRSSSCGVWTLESLVWDETHVTPRAPPRLRSRDPHLKIHLRGGAGLSWCCGDWRRAVRGVVVQKSGPRK